MYCLGGGKHPVFFAVFEMRFLVHRDFVLLVSDQCRACMVVIIVVKPVVLLEGGTNSACE